MNSSLSLLLHSGTKEKKEKVFEAFAFQWIVSAEEEEELNWKRKMASLRLFSLLFEEKKEKEKTTEKEKKVFDLVKQIVLNEEVRVKKKRIRKKKNKKKKKRIKFTKYVISLFLFFFFSFRLLPKQ